MTPDSQRLSTDYVATAQFKAWLHRPLIDLGSTGATGNPHVAGTTYAYRAMAERKAYPRLHGLLNPSVRKAIVQEARLPRYGVDDPLDLEDDLRTHEWSELCLHLQNFSHIEVEAQLRVVWLLHRICLHGAILKYVPAISENDVRRSEPKAGLAFMRGLAKLAFCNDGQCDLDTTDLEQVARSAPAGGWARIEAAYFLAVAAAKLRHDPERLRYWLAEQHRQIGCAEADEHTRCKLLSRYHRVRAFLPQFGRDWAGMTADMDLAEAWAGRMRRDTPETLAEWTTLAGAIKETRTKEALVLGDLDLAEERAKQSVVHAPSDARTHLELGQVLVERNKIEEALAAYRSAAWFGPPGTEIAWFMVGQCHEALGEPELACSAFLASVELDPMAISAAERLAELAPRIGSSDLSLWAKTKATHLAALQACRKGEEASSLRPYQQYEGVLGQS